VDERDSEEVEMEVEELDAAVLGADDVSMV